MIRATTPIESDDWTIDCTARELPGKKNAIADAGWEHKRARHWLCLDPRERRKEKRL
jgi:predicted metalloenzyme YecM